MGFMLFHLTVDLPPVNLISFVCVGGTYSP